MTDVPAATPPAATPPPVPSFDGFDAGKAIEALKKQKLTATFVDVTAVERLKGVIASGHADFDRATGIGGIPRGVMVEAYGAESVGKSTLALLLAAQMQRMGSGVLWIDQEFSFDPTYAKQFGVKCDDPAKFWLCQPNNIEDAFIIVGTMLDNGFRGLIVYDSLGAGMPRKVMDEGEMGELRPGIKSAVISVCIEQVYPQIARNECTMLFINQLRSNIKISNPWSGQQRLDNAEMGDESTITTPGGRTLRHYASMRIQLRKLHSRQWEEREKKSEIEVCFIKNKMAVPYSKATMVLSFGKGFEPCVMPTPPK